MTRTSPLRRALAVAAHLALLGAASPALACSVCGSGDPLLTSTDPAALTGRLRLQLDTEWLQVEAGSAADPGATERLTQGSLRLNAAWRATEALAVSATLPVVRKTVDRVGAGVTTRVSSATGLGDAELAARYAFWRGVALGAGRAVELAVSAGTSVPTGPNDLAAGGERIDEHGQPGTGSFGPFAGLHACIQQGAWVGFASLSGRLRTENGHAYTYGPALLWSLHAQYFPARRVAVDLGLDGRAAGADRAGGSAVPETGGTVWSVAPAVYVGLGQAPWLFVRGQVPLVARLRGAQELSPSVVAGLQYQLL
jgi:hypothetical protein